MITGEPAIEKTGKSYQPCTVINSRQGNISPRSIPINKHFLYQNHNSSTACSYHYPPWVAASLVSESTANVYLLFLLIMTPGINNPVG